MYMKRDSSFHIDFWTTYFSWRCLHFRYYKRKKNVL